MPDITETVRFKLRETVMKMKRLIIQELRKWKTRTSQKPLILRGARQGQEY